VAVLWILAALATFASIYAVYVSNAVAAARLHDDRIQSQALLSAALDLTAYQLIGTSETERPSRGSFTFRLGGAAARVDFSSESGRIDLNSAPKDLLAGLFTALGAAPPNADYFADRVIGWRTPQGDDGKEAEAYRVAGLSYGPRGALFSHVAELWLVFGLPPQLVERALPYLTVFSGQAGINALAAEPLVVAALPGMNPQSLKAFLSLRAAGGQDGQAAVRLLNAAAQSMVSLEASRAYRVTINADLGNNRRIAGTAVVLIQVGEDEPFRVLSWADSTDGSVLYELPRTGSR
jgi:general secretion pathway protein K